MQEKNRHPAHFVPKKSFGQNFLINPGIVEKIIRTAGLTGNELVVEVGPGFGVLTDALLASGVRVQAIEKDNLLFAELQKKYRDNQDARERLELIHADALKVPPPIEPYLLVANIPYSITSPLLDHYIRDAATEGLHLPERAVLLVQKEVAQKICAKPPRMNVLALHVQTFGKPRMIATVSRGSFRPVPKVDSAIIEVSLRGQSPKQSRAVMLSYFSLIHRSFSQKRKMLRAVLPAELLKKAKIEGTRRAETLNIEEWLSLAL